MLKRLSVPVLGAVLTLAAATAAAFPGKTITIVVPTAAGGGNDAMARVIAQKMGPLLGQTIIIENKAGAGGALACEAVARATPDGHTIMFGYIATHAMNPALQKLRYDPVADFEPIGMVGSSPTVLTVSPKVAVKNVSELLSQLKSKPGSYNYASAGNGTAPHYAAELFKLSTGTSMLHIPYRGAAPAINDVLAGEAQIFFPSIFTALSHIKSGKLRALAIAGSKRSPHLPDVPTLKEVGVEGVDVAQWYAFFAPAKTPKPIIEKLNKALNQALSDPETVRKLEEHGLEIRSSTPEKLRSVVQAELVRWKAVVQKAKMTPD